jgi:hypothetical protein
MLLGRGFSQLPEAGRVENFNGFAPQFYQAAMLEAF